MNDYQEAFLKEGKINLDIELTEKCNLHCRGCMAGCPLHDKNNCKDYDYNQFHKDLCYLKSIGAKFGRINISGSGEPSLVNDLHKYLSTINEIFPDEFKTLNTNGVAIYKDLKKLSLFTQYNNFNLVLSGYGGLLKMDDILIKQLNTLGITAYYQYDKNGCPREKTVMHKTMTYAQPYFDQKENYTRCKRRLIILKQSRIYPCLVCLSLKDRNRLFETNYKDESVDLYSLKSNDDLLALEHWDNNKGVDLCRYCVLGNSEFEMIPWAPNYPVKREDYIRE